MTTDASPDGDSWEEELLETGEEVIEKITNRLMVYVCELTKEDFNKLAKELFLLTVKNYKPKPTDCRKCKFSAMNTKDDICCTIHGISNMRWKEANQKGDISKPFIEMVSLNRICLDFEPKVEQSKVLQIEEPDE